MKLQDLGICTMPGCLEPAAWVHGLPMQDQQGHDVFPWKVCDCCHDSVKLADAMLHGHQAMVAGICDPDEVFWCIEARRVAVQQMKKLEAKS